MKLDIKYIVKIIVIISITFLVFMMGKQVEAKTTESLMEEQLEYYARNIDLDNITKEDILKVYDEISEQYTNDEIADIIEENAEEIKKQGIGEDVITAGANFIR